MGFVVCQAKILTMTCGKSTFPCLTISIIWTIWKVFVERFSLGNSFHWFEFFELLWIFKYFGILFRHFFVLYTQIIFLFFPLFPIIQNNPNVNFPQNISLCFFFSFCVCQPKNCQWTYILIIEHANCHTKSLSINYW